MTEQELDEIRERAAKTVAQQGATREPREPVEYAQANPAPKPPGLTIMVVLWVVAGIGLVASLGGYPDGGVAATVALVGIGIMSVLRFMARSGLHRG